VVEHTPVAGRTAAAVDRPAVVVDKPVGADKPVAVTESSVGQVDRPAAATESLAVETALPAALPAVAEWPARTGHKIWYWGAVAHHIDCKIEGLSNLLLFTETFL